MANDCKTYVRVKSDSKQSTRNMLMASDAIDRFNNVLDVVKFRKIITDLTNLASEKHGVNEGRLFIEKDVHRMYPQAVPNENAFRAIDQINGSRDNQTDPNKGPSIDPDGQLSMFYRPDGSINVDEVNSEYSETVIGKLSEQLNNNFPGIDAQFITTEQARALSENVPENNKWNGEPAMFKDGKVYFVGKHFTPEILLHEFSHPLVRAISLSNPELFNNLYNKIIITGEGQVVLSTVQSKYPDLSFNTPLYKEEVIVRALTQMALNQRGGVNQSEGFVKAIKNFLFQVKQVLRKVFGNKIKVENLDVNTSLQDLAKMLQGSTFDIKSEQLTGEDLVAYFKQMKAENEAFKLLNTKTRVMLNNNMYQVAARHLAELKANKDYASMLDILKDELGQDMLQKIKENLSRYYGLLDDKIEELNKDMNHVEAQVSSMVLDLHITHEASKRMSYHMKDISTGDLSQEDMRKLTGYNKFIGYWDRYLDMMDMHLADAGVKPENELRTLISSIKSNFKDAKNYSKLAYEKSSLELMRETLQPLADNIDKTHMEIMEHYTKNNASKGLIDKQIRLYNESRLSSYTDAQGIKVDPIKDYLTGKRGDAPALSSFLEGFMYNSDPIVGGFALFIKNHMTDVLTTAQQKHNQFINDLDPLLNKIGFKGRNAQDLGKLLTTIDTTSAYETNPDTNEVSLVERKVVTLLNPFHNHRYAISKMEYDAAAARDKANSSNTKEDYAEAARLLEKLQEHKNKYFHQDYTPQFYDKDSVFKDNDPRIQAVKQQAKEERRAKLDEIISLQKAQVDEFTDKETLDIIKHKWREFAQMHALVDEFCQMKTGDDLIKAKALKAYRERSNEVYKWVEIPGSFQNALTKYEENLVAQGMERSTKEDSPFYNARQEWINDNTVVKVTDEHYKKLNNIYANIELLRQRLNKGNEHLSNEISKNNDIIRESIIGFRDDDNQPNADEMSHQRIYSIRQAQLALDKLQILLSNIGSLTEEEYAEYEALLNNKNRSQADKERFAELIDKKNEADDTEQKLIKSELKVLYAKLEKLQSKKPTTYYVDHLNALLGGNYTQDTANNILDELKLLNLLNNGNDAFDKWFYNNHIQKRSYVDPETGFIYKSWQRLVVWNTTEPLDSKNYISTDLLDNTGKVVETIQRAPGKRFFVREVKPEYINQKIVGKTVDNKGHWLPRLVSEGAPADSPYINQDYFSLKKNNPDVFNILEKVKEHHIANQEGLQDSSKLYLDLPRFRKENVDIIQGSGLQGVSGAVTGWIQNIKDYFSKSADDVNMNLNYNPLTNLHESIKLNKADLFGEEEGTVPIVGLSNIEADKVSLDVFHSTMHYMLSAERQKKLMEIEPIAKAMIDTASSNSLEKIEENSLVNTVINRFANKKGENIRAKAMKNLYDREFKGETNTGFAKENDVLNKVTSMLFKTASFGFFALNIPSALKNSISAGVQNIIMASGGKDLSIPTLTAGHAWALSASTQISSQLYSGKVKGLDTQLIDIFDAFQGRLEEHFGSTITRNIEKDILNLSWMMSPRKWTEINASLGLFGGMMNYKTITKLDGTIIKYIDAWEVNQDNQIQLKPGIDPTYGIGGKEFKIFRNKIHMASNDLNGAFAKFDQPEAQRYLAYRTISYMRRYLTSMFMSRVASERYNVGHGRMTEGFYRTNAKTFIKVANELRKGMNGFQQLTPMEKQAFGKLLGEGLQCLLLWALVHLVLGWDENDPEKYAKLRAESGPLPLPGVVDTGVEFNPIGFSHAHSILLGMNVLQENSQWFSPTTYKNLADFKSVAFGPTLNTYATLLGDIGNGMLGNESAYYKKDVGPYSWEQEGSWKFFNHAAHMVGVTGGTTDPTLAVKNFVAVQIRP